MATFNLQVQVLNVNDSHEKTFDRKENGKTVETVHYTERKVLVGIGDADAMQTAMLRFTGDASDVAGTWQEGQRVTVTMANNKATC